MSAYLIEASPQAGIQPGWYFSLIFGFAGLGLQPGFRPQDPPRAQFAYGFRFLSNGVITEQWETYTASLHADSKLRKHMGSAGLLPAGAFDPTTVVGKTALLLFAPEPRKDGSWKTALVSMAPATRPPANSGITRELLRVHDTLVVDRDTPIAPDALARLPGWLAAKIAPPPPLQAVTYGGVTLPPPPAAPVAPAAPPPPAANPTDEDW